MKDDILINTQLAIFFEQPIPQPSVIYSDLTKSFDWVDGNRSNVQSIPNETSLYEVPVIQLRSSDEVIALNVARVRADLFIAGEGNQKFNEKKEEIISKGLAILDFFSSKTKIKRIGFVTRFFIEDPLQGKTIAKLIVDPFKSIGRERTEEVLGASLTYATRESINGFKVNDYTIIDRFFAKISGVGENIRGILITRDFSTSPDTNYSDEINEESIEAFIGESCNRFELEKIKDILWPREE